MIDDFRPLWRVPLLCLGAGALVGGLEMIQLAATLKLSLAFGEAAILGASAVASGAALAVGLSVPVALFIEFLSRDAPGPARNAAGLSVVSGGLAAWFLWPVALAKLQVDLVPAAAAFGLTPVGVVGVVWFNAHFWLRREEVGRAPRFGWLPGSLAGGLLLAMIGAGWLSSRSFGSARALEGDPSVVVVTIDTLRRDHLSLYGSTVVQTPFLDSLAADAIVFDDAVTPFPETGPAHAALWTGRHPVRNGMLSNGHSLGMHYDTLAELLAEEGYATGAFLSSIAVDSRTGLDQGFEVYDDDYFPWVRGLAEVRLVSVGIRALMRFGDPAAFPYLLERPAPDTIDRAWAWMSSHADRPFLSWVHLFEPHSPYEPHGLPGFEDNGVPGAPALDHRAILAQEPGYAYTDGERAALRRLYAEEVAYIDTQLADLVGRLRTLDRPVLLVITADHGEMLGEHGVDFNHHGVWEENVRVPLIVVPLDRSLAGKRVPSAVRLMDLPATILAALKLDPMKRSEGGALWPLVSNPTPGWASLLMGRRTAALSDGTLFGYRVPAADGRGVIKFILDADTGSGSLFALIDDPGEDSDIAVKHPTVVADVRRQVLDEVGALAEGLPDTPLDPGTQDALEALGYLQ